MCIKDTKDKLQVKAVRPKPTPVPETRRMLAVPGETWAKLNDVSLETGITIGKLTAMMVDFCLERLEIVEVDPQ